MSAATPPPSIPPRKRPAGASGGASSAPRPTGETPAGAISVPGRGGSGTTTAEPAAEESTRLGWPSSSSSSDSDGHDVAERTTRVAPASIPPRTKTGVGPDRGASSPAAEKPANSPATSTTAGAPAGTDDDEATPLAAAVESATSWLKKAGAATSAAISSAARPKTEEPPVTTTASAAGAAAAGAAGAARPAATNPSGVRPQTGRIPVGQPHSGPRRVRLAISRVDPWSVMKLSFLLSVAIGLMIVIATAVVWYTLDGMHVFSKANDLVTQVTGTESTVDILQYVEFRRVVSGATLVSVVNVFLMTALATIGAFLYNIVAALVGGVHVTMTDE